VFFIEPMRGQELLCSAQKDFGYSLRRCVNEEPAE